MEKKIEMEREMDKIEESPVKVPLSLPVVKVVATMAILAALQSTSSEEIRKAALAPSLSKDEESRFFISPSSISTDMSTTDSAAEGNFNFQSEEGSRFARRSVSKMKENSSAIKMFDTHDRPTLITKTVNKVLNRLTPDTVLNLAQEMVELLASEGSETKLENEAELAQVAALILRNALGMERHAPQTATFCALLFGRLKVGGKAVQEFLLADIFDEFVACLKTGRTQMQRKALFGFIGHLALNKFITNDLISTIINDTLWPSEETARQRKEGEGVLEGLDLANKEKSKENELYGFLLESIIHLCNVVVEGAAEGKKTVGDGGSESGEGFGFMHLDKIGETLKDHFETSLASDDTDRLRFQWADFQGAVAPNKSNSHSISQQKKNKKHDKNQQKKENERNYNNESNENKDNKKNDKSKDVNKNIKRLENVFSEYFEEGIKFDTNVLRRWADENNEQMELELFKLGFHLISKSKSMRTHFGKFVALLEKVSKMNLKKQLKEAVGMFSLLKEDMELDNPNFIGDLKDLLSECKEGRERQGWKWEERELEQTRKKLEEMEYESAMGVEEVNGVIELING